MNEKNPTDDEREALAKLLDEIDSEWLMGEARPPYPSEMAHELILRGFGFRRSEVPEPSTEPQGEPSDAQVDAAMNAFYGKTDASIAHPFRKDMRAALRAAGGVR